MTGAPTRSRQRRRLPGWLVVVLMALFIAGMGVAIYLNVRPDPTLPRATVEKK